MSLFRPDVYVQSVTDLDPVADLVNCGIKGLILDMDNTLRPRDTGVIPSDVVAWLERVSAAGVKACILSNSTKDSTIADGQALGLPVVIKAFKPLPFAYPKALALLGVEASSAMAVGDQLSTDVWGANLAGIRSALVIPQCQVDLGHTAVIRKVEAMFLKGMEPRQI